MSARILAVDDEQYIRTLLQDALTMQEYDVTTAPDGVEASKLLRDEKYDVLITDLKMPRMDGRRLAELASQIQPDIGIIIITAYPSEASVLDTFRHGASSYLVKPVDLKDLFSAVRDVERERVTLGAEPSKTSTPARSLRVESPREGWIEFEAPSHHLFVERFANLFQLLIHKGITEEELDDIRIAVYELGSNAVEWGNSSDVRKPIRISAIIEPDQLVLVIEDQGRGFIPTNVPNPVEKPEEVAQGRRELGKRPGGYGIAMAKAAMDDIFYNKAGNTVVMTKHIGKHKKSKESDDK